jgi:hypothetical protein
MTEQPDEQVDDEQGELESCVICGEALDGFNETSCWSASPFEGIEPDPWISDGRTTY